MINFKLSYTNVLELIIFIIIIFLVNRFIQNEYVCSIEYNIIDFNRSLYFNDSNISNYSYVYYTKTETLFIIEKNTYLNQYNSRVKCNWKFLNNK